MAEEDETENVLSIEFDNKTETAVERWEWENISKRSV